MGELAGLFTVVQLFFAVVIGLYFWNLLRNQQSNKVAVDRDSKKEMDKLNQLRSIRLTEPLSEKTRPTRFDEIIGQADGLKGLRAALCGSNPQHIIVYGPPGVGKTAAARLVLEEAKNNPHSPFNTSSKFVELDATTARFDERGIADPLIGSVHDPIYQGAGPMGVAGIPQPKPGAVTKAHGGVLFIDEIGELHPVQMNKLLKVLEDRKVFLESAYYNNEDSNIPKHIHEIFTNGLPADFRLIGATTRMPDEIPPAIRSRCVEIYFRSLLPKEIGIIARNAANKIEMPLKEEALKVVCEYATNGREAVNIVQVAAGVAINEEREQIEAADIEWVVNSSQIPPRPKSVVPQRSRVGTVTGLAVYGPNMGALLEIEANAYPTTAGTGKLIVTGAVDEEELGRPGKTVRRKSMARGSVENVLTVLRRIMSEDPRDYDIHVNFPGGVPIDGPSAGVAIATAVYSAIKEQKVDHYCAMTGEVSIHGTVKPVGGIVPKIEAARLAGVKRVFIPRENYLHLFNTGLEIEVVPVDNLQEILAAAFETEGCYEEGKVVASAQMVQGLSHCQN
ncbi:MAG: ATP-dependent protease LonB [Firmicutes bacterium]|nr:ATP-dependent protease LonB [Bacillota bacterium]